MRNRLWVGVLASIALATASVDRAHAQGNDGCAILREAIDAAGSNFRSIRGRSTGDGFYTTSLTMPNAHCELFTIEGDWDWNCTWRGAPGEGQAQGQSLYSQVGQCLQGWRSTPYGPSTRRPTGRTLQRWDGSYTDGNVRIRIAGAEKESSRFGRYGEVQITVQQ